MLKKDLPPCAEDTMQRRPEVWYAKQGDVPLIVWKPSMAPEIIIFIETFFSGPAKAATVYASGEILLEMFLETFNTFLQQFRVCDLQ